MGASLALEVTGLARDAREGVARAADAIDSGAAARVLEALDRFGAEQARRVAERAGAAR